jgi:anti-sigma B factor antagonist
MSEPTEFRVEVLRTVDDVAVVQVSGELDLFVAPEFRECLTGALEEGTPRIVIDLAGVTFIDSSAIGVLIAGARRSAEVRRELMIVCPAGSVARILEITGLHRVFAVYATRADALNATAHGTAR